VAKLAQAVSQAANALDKLKPGWAQEINLETLESRVILARQKCVLGQLFGDFAIGYNKINSDEDPAINAAFVKDGVEKFWKEEVQNRCGDKK